MDDRNQIYTSHSWCPPCCVYSQYLFSRTKF